MPNRAAPRRAFCSAWTQMQRSYPVPEGNASRLAHRRHPPSSQLVMWRGVPLYPVETMRASCAMTAPTRLPVQLARARTAIAIPIRYSSILGRDCPSWFMRPPQMLERSLNGKAKTENLLGVRSPRIAGVAQDHQQDKNDGPYGVQDDVVKCAGSGSQEALVPFVQRCNHEGAKNR